MAKSIAAFAGNFLNAFTQSKESKQTREDEDKKNKLLLELMEMQLNDARTKSGATQRIIDSLSDLTGGAKPVPKFETGPTGEFVQTGSTPGPAAPPMSLTDFMANNQVDLALSGLGPQISQMALSRGVSQSQNPQDFLQSPEGSGLALGAGMNPAQLFGQERRTDSVLARLDAANIDPASPEGQDLIKQSIAGGNALEGLQAQLMTLQALNAEREIVQSERERKAAESAAKTSTRNLLRNAQEMIAINDRLEGTVLQTGVPLTEFRRGFASLMTLLGPLGFDEEQVQMAIDDHDRFNKLAEQMVIDLLPKLAAAGTITDTKYESLSNTLASTKVSPGANRLVLADMIELGIESADTLGMSMDEREALEEVAAEIRSRGDQSRPTNGGRFKYNPETRTL